MSKWKPLVRSDPTGWLLEGENPSVRYYTLTDILEKPRNDPETCTARSMIMQEGVVPKILAKQRRGGYWETAEDFYIRAKYKGTVLQLIPSRSSAQREMTSESERRPNSFLRILRTEKAGVSPIAARQAREVTMRESYPA